MSVSRSFDLHSRYRTNQLAVHRMIWASIECQVPEWGLMLIFGILIKICLICVRHVFAHFGFYFGLKCLTSCIICTTVKWKCRIKLRDFQIWILRKTIHFWMRKITRKISFLHSAVCTVHSLSFTASASYIKLSACACACASQI